MCGIIGFTGKNNAKDTIINALKALEYRGYDSAGLTLIDKNDFITRKCSGRVEALEDMCKALEFDSDCGIGHTRWATHGAPSTDNAHPHESENVVLVHNGIIENYLEIKKELINDGYTFKSETDTECIVYLIDKEFKKTSDPKASIHYACKKLKGSFALAMMFKGRTGEVWGVRRDNPLIAVKGENGCYLASDIPALLPYSKRIIRPDDDEILFLNKRDIILFDKELNAIPYTLDEIDWNLNTAQKEGYAHFMLKEIFEQPKAIQRTALSNIKNGTVDLSAIGVTDEVLKDVDSISVIACGSATHAGLVGKYIIEKLVKIPVFVTTASEYRYDPPVTVGNALIVAVSQSGETADTLAALRLARSNGNKALGIINSVGSAIARESDWVFYTNAGPEIAVATTKGYTTQLTAFYVLALALAKAKGTIEDSIINNLCETLFFEVHKSVETVLSQREKIKSIAKEIYKHNDLYFIGRGIDNFAAIECSLKLKEISYIHSEAYAAGELKHGTLSLIVDNTPVVALACDNRYYDKMIGNIREVTARGGRVVLVCQQDFPSPLEYADNVFVLPKCDPMFSPLISVVFSQLMAYEVAILRGCDVDHPRNLAKSVTVE